MADQAPQKVRCSICKGEFPRYPDHKVPGCSTCAISGAPWHFSSDSCESRGMRRHEGCRGHAHCTCDSCF